MFDMTTPRDPRPATPEQIAFLRKSFAEDVRSGKISLREIFDENGASLDSEIVARWLETGEGEPPEGWNLGNLPMKEPGNGR